MKKAIVIGAGIGGLGTAIQLAQKGFEVSVYEKNDKPGGRCQLIEKDGHYFDTGPTMYLYPQLYKDFFKLIGEDINSHLKLLRADPTYLLCFNNETNLVLTSDPEKMRSQLENIEKGSFVKFLNYLNAGRNYYNISIKRLIKQNIRKPTDYFNLTNLFLMIKSKGLKNHYSYVSRYFENVLLRKAFTFQDSYLSLSPFEAPAVFSQFPYMEAVHGSFLPQGGMYQVIVALEKIAIKNHVKIYYGCEIGKINIDSLCATGVSVIGGGIKTADFIIVNADLSYAYNKLLPDQNLSRKILKKKYSCSALVFHWGLKKRYRQLLTHNLFFSHSYKKSFDQVITGRTPPSHPHFYIQAPTRTDPTRAPKNQDTLSVMIPINHLNNAERTDWEIYKTKIRKYVTSRLKRHGLKDIESQIKFEICHTPSDWENRFNLTNGSIYGLHHNLLQMGYLREKRSHSKYKNLFFVGASNHPGSGLPTVLTSSIFTANEIITQ